MVASKRKVGKGFVVLVTVPTGENSSYSDINLVVGKGGYHFTVTCNVDEIEVEDSVVYRNKKLAEKAMEKYSKDAPAYSHKVIEVPTYEFVY